MLLHFLHFFCRSANFFLSSSSVAVLRSLCPLPGFIQLDRKFNVLVMWQCTLALEKEFRSGHELVMNDAEIDAVVSSS